VLSLPPAVRIFVATTPTNMHLSFDRLAALARDVMQRDPLSGHLFAYFNRTADRVKILYWDRSGFCLWCKRLERGIFRLPRAGATALELDAAELTLLLDGIDLTTATRRRRFIPPVGVATAGRVQILGSRGTISPARASIER
jgi:transposase